jgi:hypothetical protein
MLKTKSKGRTKDKSLLLFFGVELSEHKGWCIIFPKECDIYLVYEKVYRIHDHKSPFTRITYIFLNLYLSFLIKALSDCHTLNSSTIWETYFPSRWITHPFLTLSGSGEIKEGQLPSFLPCTIFFRINTDHDTNKDEINGDNMSLNWVATEVKLHS